MEGPQPGAEGTGSTHRGSHPEKHAGESWEGLRVSRKPGGQGRALAGGVELECQVRGGFEAEAEPSLVP